MDTLPVLIFSLSIRKSIIANGELYRHAHPQSPTQ